MLEDSLENNKYIVFSVDDQDLAIPLMSAREVVENFGIKPVAKTKNYFSGVTNIRGEVIGVIDLRKRFNREVYEGRSVLILFEFEGHTLAALVDKLIRVDELTSDEIDEAQGVKDFLDISYVRGVYNKNSKIITIVDIKEFLLKDSIKAA